MLRRLFVGPKFDVQYTDDEEKVFAATNKIGPAILFFAVAGLAFLLLWAVGQALGASAGWATFFQTLGLYALIAFAAGAAGGLAGFLFGIPRTREAAEALQQGDTVTARRAVLAANTNLERVSDWLTTLLLGATLVQLEPLVKWIGNLGNNLTTAPVATMMPIIIVYFLVLGFLGVYLMTRLYLTYSLQLMLKLGLEAEVPATIEATRAALTVALRTNDAAAMRAALAGFDAQKSQPAAAADAPLNALAARIAARLSKAPGLDPKERETLGATVLDALGKATNDAGVKKAVQTDRTDLQGLDQALQTKVDNLLK